jgi:colanic acid/amylovoran biosynthesis glycosyltransferase
MMKIGYLMPEFPGQTHVWMWREICHMREWGAEINIFSTRKPDEASKARHDFAQAAEAETYYLWPQSPVQILTALVWAISKHPVGFWQMLKLCFVLDLDEKPAWRKTLPLLLVAPVLARAALKQNIQQFHIQTASNSAILGMMVKRLVGIPYSMVCNANLEWWGGAMLQKLSDAEFTVAVTDWLLAQIRSDYPTLRAEQAIMAHHGVNTKKWLPSNGLSHHQDDTFKVITVGRLHSCKGHDVLIKSVKLLLDNNRKVSLKIVGSGPEEEALKSLVQELGLTDFVTFTGSLSEDQIMDLMHQSDAFALASHAEPLGVVYMEAMAMGVPTIGTNAGGVPEIISHQQDGLLVPPGDEVALKAALESLIDNPQLRQQLAQNGRRTIVEQFDSRVGAATVFKRLHGVSPVAVSS